MARPNPPAGPRTDYGPSVTALQTRLQDAANERTWTRVYYGTEGIIVTDGYTIHKFAMKLKDSEWIYSKWEINWNRVVHAHDVNEPDGNERMHRVGAYDE